MPAPRGALGDNPHRASPRLSPKQRCPGPSSPPCSCPLTASNPRAMSQKDSLLREGFLQATQGLEPGGGGQMPQSTQPAPFRDQVPLPPSGVGGTSASTGVGLRPSKEPQAAPGQVWTSLMTRQPQASEQSVGQGRGLRGLHSQPPRTPRHSSASSGG